MEKDKLLEIIPKEKKKVPRWVNVTLLFSIILLLVVAGWFYLLKKQIANAQQRKALVEKNIEETKNKINGFVQKAEINTLADKIRRFSSILEEHKTVSKAIEFLKSKCHPNVHFTNLSVDSEKNTAEIGATADNFKSVSQQIASLRGEKYVKEVALSDISLSKEGGIDFELLINFSKELFKSK